MQNMFLTPGNKMHIVRILFIKSTHLIELWIMEKETNSVVLLLTKISRKNAGITRLPDYPSPFSKNLEVSNPNR